MGKERNQIKTGAVLNYLSILINNVIALTYTPYMLRIMGQNEYGLYSLVSSVVAYLTILDLGFNNAVIRYTVRYKEEGKEGQLPYLWGMFLCIYLVLSFVLILISCVIYYKIDYLFGNSMTIEDITKVRIMFVLLVVNLSVTFPMSIFTGIVTANEKFIFQKTLNIIRIILNPICMMILLSYGYRAIAMVVVTTLFNLLILIINYIYCKTEFHVKLKIKHFDFSLLKTVAYYSFWIFLCSIVDRFYWSSGQFLLGIFVNATEIAIFAIAIQIQSFYGGFSFAISSLLLPRVVKLSLNTDKEQATRELSLFFIKVARLIFFPMSLILCGYILFGKQFVCIWAGQNYENAYYMSLCFLIPELFTSMQQMSYSILQAQDKVKFRGISLFVVSLICVIISIPFIKYYQGFGASICIGMGLVIGHLIVLNIYYQKCIGLNMKLFWNNTLKLIVFPLMITASYAIILKIYPSNNIGITILHIAIFTILYTIGSWRINFDEYEKSIFILPIRKILKI